MLNRLVSIFCLLIFHVCAFGSPLRYHLHIQGVEDPQVLKTILSTPHLLSLKEQPPQSTHTLRYRLDSATEDVTKTLKSYGYYEAVCSVQTTQYENEIEATIQVEEGPLYKIGSVTIEMSPQDGASKADTFEIDEFKNLAGKRALAKEILKLESKILFTLSELSYANARILHQEFIVDGKTKTLSAKFVIDKGKALSFGSVHIKGLRRVKKEFIEKKIAWKVGEPYKISQVEKTKSDLMSSGFFSSVVIQHVPSSEETSTLTMQVEVIESNQKNISIGATYQTFYGPGLTFGWHNRNLDGMGSSLSLQGDATKDTHSGTATFIIPDFFKHKADFIFQAQAMNESILAYDQRSYSALTRVDFSHLQTFRASAGVKIENLIVTDSVSNGSFVLLEIPCYIRLSSAQGLLDPKHGFSAEYRAHPSLRFSSGTKPYLSHAVTLSHYLPLKSSSIIVAQQFLGKSIIADNIQNIPVPKRVLEGDEQQMRGYAFHSISPLQNLKPIGGKSGLFYTFELRLKLSKSVGVVPFFDIGNVFKETIPDLKGKWLKSTGLGLRYYSVLGPLRIDVAFPLDKRKDIDPNFRLILSIGQTF